MAYLAILSAGDGRRAGFAAVAGIALGLLIVGAAAAFGVAALVSGSYTAYQILRWSGVMYLLWLAWDGWKTGEEISPEHVKGHILEMKFFKRGLIVNLLNPKAAVFYIAILPAFVNPAASVLAQTMALTVAYVGVATVIHFLIVVLATEARKFFDKPRQVVLVRRLLSLMLAGVAVWFALSTGGTAPLSE